MSNVPDMSHRRAHGMLCAHGQYPAECLACFRFEVADLRESVEARISAAVAEERAKYSRELQQALTRISNLEAEKAMAVAAEREACAKLVEDDRLHGNARLAAAIRAQGNPVTQATQETP